MIYLSRIFARLYWRMIFLVARTAPAKIPPCYCRPRYCASRYGSYAWVAAYACTAMRTSLLCYLSPSRLVSCLFFCLCAFPLYRNQLWRRASNQGVLTLGVGSDVVKDVVKNISHKIDATTCFAHVLSLVPRRCGRRSHVGRYSTDLLAH